MTEREWLNDNKLSLDIWNNKYRFEDETFEAWLDRVSGGNNDIKRLIREKKFLFGGRTLANRGVPNSGSFSNCYSIGYVPDSLDGIMDVAHKIAMTFKAQGGQGLSLSKIRPKGSLIAGQYPSDGIVPFMNIFNTVTESVSQGGSRKGALMMSIDVWHPEAETFIKIKEDLNKINKANLSVEVDNDFMEHVSVNSDQLVERKGISGDLYIVNPAKIFHTICESAWRSAEPGILFVDRLRNYNIMEFVDDYQIETTNPCGEQPLPKHGACNLCSINISEYVLDPWTSKAKIDYFSLENDLVEIVSEMDKVLEENASRHALPEQKEMALKYRNIGIGIMGLADMFVKMGIKYGSPDSIGIATTLMRFIFRTSIKISAANGKIYGNFPGYDPKVWDSTIIRNAFTEEEIEELKKQNTLRNCSLLSIAPTGSIGTMLNVSTGVEPFFALSFNRKTDNLNGTYKVEIKAVEEYREATGDTNAILPDYFITSEEIPWKERIDIQAALQEFCDTAISSTVNLPKETTINDVKELYKYAWKKGLKGITIYRDGSRDPILSVDKKEENPTTAESISEQVSLNTENAKLQLEAKHELRRGEIVKTGEIHCLDCVGTISRDNLGQVLSGETYKYHTACGTLYITVNKDSEGNIVEIFTNSSKNGTCKANLNGETRLASLALRAGIKTEEVIDTLKSIQCQSCAFARAKGNKIDGTSCPDIISKCLKQSYSSKKLVPNTKFTKVTIQDIPTSNKCPECGQELIHSGGCIQCSCGYSKCN